ncbi:OPT oligopeptide transporter protein-domain-containing protein [Chytriomyces cf. hyalinus JEL632]|nr:OPT oligopeptide transporter protein-domain-containing protein [Chytriomyces cf. hyalinus JEL632]
MADTDKAVDPIPDSLEKFEVTAQLREENYIDEIYEIIDAAVPRTDDPSLPASTVRVWLLGLFFGILMCAINTIFTFRTNQFNLNPFIAVLLAYPCGIFMAKVLPAGLLNPGPFNYKEHALIYVMVSCMAATPYALYNIVGQKYQLYQNDLSLISSIAFAIVTQCFGYGFAGLTRRYLVRPAAMLWPANLGTIAMLNSLHGRDEGTGTRYRMSRFKFFWLATSAMFFYQMLPSYIAPMLGALSIICWFTNNKKDNTVYLAMGSSAPTAGMGFMSFTLDWSIVTYANPIIYPLWATVNQVFGYWLFLWVVVPLCWYTGAFYNDRSIGAEAPYNFALNTPGTYNRNGKFIKNTKFVMRNPENPSSLILNQTFYDENKPILITTFFAMEYACSFVVFVASLVHVGLWYGKDIWQRFRATMSNLDKEDIHAKLMDAYPDVPDWWYMAVLAVNMVVGIVVCQWGGFDLPWWGTILAVALALVSIIPIGTIQAVSGQQIGLNVMSEFLIGLLIPGRISAVMAFKTLSYMSMNQGLFLVGDMKLGHYLKLPPKAMFMAQLIPTVVGTFISTAVAAFMYESFGKKEVPVSSTYPAGFVWLLQELPATSGWSSNNYKVFMNAGAIWGAIGPARFFGPDSPYFKTLLGFGIGLVLPVIFWGLHKLQPNSFWHMINIPVIFVFPLQAGGQRSDLITPLLVALVVNYYVKKYRNTWWKKYAYVMSAAFDVGSGLMVLILFFATQFNPEYHTPFPAWFMNSGDAERCLPDAKITCNEHDTMGNAYGFKYLPEQDPTCNL